MKRFTLFGLLAAALVVSAVAQEAWAWGRRGGRVAYTPASYCGAPAYYAPNYYPQSPVLRPARPGMEVGAYDGRGFEPKTITVPPGTTVRWVNRGQEAHTVTSRDGLFDSGELRPGATFSMTFTRPGTFNYFCRPHEKMGMVGTVIVGAAGSGGPAPTVY